MAALKRCTTDRVKEPNNNKEQTPQVFHPDGQTDRHRDRQRWTDKQRERQTTTDRQTKTNKDKQTD